MDCNLQPGLELDALVISKVLDTPVFRYHREAEERWGKAYTEQTYALCELGERHVIYSPTGASPYRPSADITHAWRIVEHIQAVRQGLDHDDDKAAMAVLALSNWYTSMYSICWPDLSAVEAAHRICTLAVDAMWYKEG